MIPNRVRFFTNCLVKLALFVMGIKQPTPRQPISHSDMRVWAHKSAALACENLMLSLRAFGYDSCPMEGMDSKRIHGSVINTKL